MNVLIAAEDFRKDQFILKQLLSRLLAMIDRPRANIDACRDPLLRGVNEALTSQRAAESVRQHGGITDIFVLCVDRDSDEERRQRLDPIEGEFGADQPFLAVNAWKEIEIWLLAGPNSPNDWRWSDLRVEVHAKEQYFDRLARERETADGPGCADRVLSGEAARRIDAVRRKRPEDFNDLARRLQAVAQDQ